LSEGRDPGQWFKACFAGTVFCIVWYTFFGLFFVRLHAGMISSQMELMLFYDMTPLVMPDDEYLVSLIHQLGSSLFFGCTTGVLNAMIAMVASMSPWMQRRFARHDVFVFILLGCTFTFLGFSAEMPFVSAVFGFVCPAVFFVPWAVISRRGGNTRTPYRKWLVMVLIVILPFLSLLAFSRASFETVRDSMLEIPGARSLSTFYYDHTYLAAHIIKPPSAYEQKVIAISSDVTRIGPRPHGTLWVRAEDPCAVQGSTIAASTSPEVCPSVMLSDRDLLNISGRIMQELHSTYDYNEKIRSGIGLFFYKGPLVVIPVLFMLWFSLFLARLFERGKIAAGVVILGYLGCFLYPFHTIILQCQLRENPQLIHEFVLSEHVSKRYLALKTFPEEIRKHELIRFSRDPSARIRLNAIYEAGNRKDPEFMKMFEEALRDDQLNVRTRACLGLGNLGDRNALFLLEKVLHNDPSWYVRGYAYRAIGRIRPITRSVVFQG